MGKTGRRGFLIGMAATALQACTSALGKRRTATAGDVVQRNEPEIDPEVNLKGDYDMKQVCTPGIQAVADQYLQRVGTADIRDLKPDDILSGRPSWNIAPPGEDTVFLYRLAEDEAFRLRYAPAIAESYRGAAYLIFQDAVSMIERAAQVRFVDVHSEEGKQLVSEHPERCNPLNLCLTGTVETDLQTGLLALGRTDVKEHSVYLFVHTLEPYFLKEDAVHKLIRHEMVHYLGRLDGHVEDILNLQPERYTETANPNTTMLTSDYADAEKGDGFPEADLCFFAGLFGAREGAVPPPENTPWTVEEARCSETSLRAR